MNERARGNPLYDLLSTSAIHVDLEAFRRKMTGDDPVNVDFWKSIVDPGLLGGVDEGVVGRAYMEEIGRL
jgi:hypothetical protein